MGDCECGGEGGGQKQRACAEGEGQCCVRVTGSASARVRIYTIPRICGRVRVRSSRLRGEQCQTESKYDKKVIT